MYHVHHIIPKHAGGTDDPSNLIRLTIEEHAEAHRILYEEHGRVEDKVAWLSLSGQISKQEIIAELKIIGSKKGARASGDRSKELFNNGDIEYINRMKLNSSKGIKKFKELYNQNKGIWWENGFKNKTHSKETLSKMRGPRPQSTGTNNSQYGTCWITNGIDNKKIKVTELNNFMALGWYKGRKF